ncbi:hypothetical protein HDK90DRAFT_264871 [Phyllosticta capitalensis]|uniref:Uncharacterized protein n=2 Tax=Phyllosticta capitalensis TaxID=121624 RepID=A0ABR1YLT1_9PEZI
MRWMHTFVVVPIMREQSKLQSKNGAQRRVAAVDAYNKHNQAWCVFTYMLGWCLSLSSQQPSCRHCWMYVLAAHAHPTYYAALCPTNRPAQQRYLAPDRRLGGRGIPCSTCRETRACDQHNSSSSSTHPISSSLQLPVHVIMATTGESFFACPSVRLPLGLRSQTFTPNYQLVVLPPLVMLGCCAAATAAAAVAAIRCRGPTNEYGAKIATRSCEQRCWFRFTPFALRRRPPVVVVVDMRRECVAWHGMAWLTCTSVSAGASSRVHIRMYTTTSRPRRCRWVQGVFIGIGVRRWSESCAALCSSARASQLEECCCCCCWQRNGRMATRQLRHQPSARLVGGARTWG